MRKLISLVLMVVLISTMTIGCGKKEKKDDSLTNKPKIESVSDIFSEVEAAIKDINSVDFSISIDTDCELSSKNNEATTMGLDGKLNLQLCSEPLSLKFDLQVLSEGLGSDIEDNSKLEGYITVEDNNLVSYIKSGGSEHWTSQVLGPYDVNISYANINTGDNNSLRDFLTSGIEFEEVNSSASSYYQLEASYDLKSLIDVILSNVVIGQETVEYQDYMKQFMDKYHLDLGKFMADVKILIDKKDYTPLVCVLDFSRSDLSDIGKLLFGESYTLSLPTCTITIKINGINTIDGIVIPFEVKEKAKPDSK